MSSPDSGERSRGNHDRRPASDPSTHLALAPCRREERASPGPCGSSFASVWYRRPGTGSSRAPAREMCQELAALRALRDSSRRVRPPRAERGCFRLACLDWRRLLRRPQAVSCRGPAMYRSGAGLRGAEERWLPAIHRGEASAASGFTDRTRSVRSRCHGRSATGRTILMAQRCITQVVADVAVVWARTVSTVSSLFLVGRDAGFTRRPPQKTRSAPRSPSSCAGRQGATRDSRDLNLRGPLSSSRGAYGIAGAPARAACSSCLSYAKDGSSSASRSPLPSDPAEAPDMALEDRGLWSRSCRPDEDQALCDPSTSA